MIFYCLNVKNDFLQSIINSNCIVWISFIPANTISFYENESILCYAFYARIISSIIFIQKANCKSLLELNSLS